MPGFMDDRMRRWLTGTGLFCLSMGSLATGGCAGGSRDAIADATPGRARLTSNQAAAKETAGRATLSDEGSGARAAIASRQPAATAPYRTTAANNAAPANPSPIAPVADTRPVQVAQKAQIPAGGSSAVILPPPRSEPAVQKPSTRPESRAVARAAGTRTTSNGRPTSSGIAQASASRVRTEAARPVPPIIRPSVVETPPTTSATGSADGFERQRADRLMARARQMLQSDFREEALRLALVAEQLEKSHQVKYRSGEETPSQFVARLRLTDSLTGETRAVAEERETRTILAEPKPAAAAKQRSAVEVIDISAGWRPSEQLAVAAGSPTVSTATPAATALPADSRLLAAAGGPESQSATAKPTVAAAQPKVPVASETSAGDELPEARAKGDLTFGETPVEVEEGSSFSLNVTTASVVGLIAGIAGLVGLSYWRRQEQRHYANSRK